MTKCWVFLAKRKNESISDTIDIINKKSWDFISPDNAKIPPRKPSYSNELGINHLVIFYHSYEKSIIAKARIQSEVYLNGNRWWVDLKDIEIFEPIQVEEPKKDLNINRPGSIYRIDCEYLQKLH